MANIEIKAVTQGRGRICNQLLRSLPLWFGIDAAIVKYVAEVETMPTFAAYDGERIAGFLSLNRHNGWTAEVHVMAVQRDLHRRGIGRGLLTAAEKYLKEFGYEFLSVKTLSPSSPNKEYELTRKFYSAVGFRPVEEFKTLWGPANPCLLMIKSLHLVA